MEPTTLAAVRSLEERGYVTREHRAGNRKNVHVSLTPRGRALKRKLVPLAEEVNRIGVEGIDPAHVAITRAVLVSIIANLARDAVGAPARLPPRAASRVRTRRG
jgi:DNA-binding MarR family transcriptional regulator